MRARALFFLSLAALLFWLAARSLTPAFDGLRLAATKDDPVALADARLDQTLTATRFSQALDAALAADDADLARSFIELGRLRRLAPTAEQERRLAALDAEAEEKTVEDFTQGFLHGARDNGPAFTGALIGDLTGYGDLRDLWSEGEKVRRGEEPDQLVVGLAAAGLALSAVTWSSVGALLPARSGMTIVKSAQKAGRLSRPLARALGATAAKAVDREALTAGFSAVAKADFAAARAAAVKVVRPGALATFRAVGEDAAAIYRRAGASGVKDALAVAEDGAELGKAARLAKARGGATRAILATLGRGALVFGGLAAAAVEAVFVFLGSLLGLATMAQRLGFWLGRRRFVPSPRATVKRSGLSPAKKFASRPKEFPTPPV
ncbi:hypothetical protein [Methylocystis parvus]|uniref:DUF2937 family protein n=1 Tax=Methylocystis parvus TaxID=134 RepID=A0A6B8M814_9HYPH|nr:hypothetical protein [Methylocystis parvus]QGM98708.1 hypothetical protein F7D14_15285 [Methylocystis parvus]WBK00944.1 hypothetical protein MMG94_04280 [Methylocystis parvus OBBP]